MDVMPESEVSTVITHMSVPCLQSHEVFTVTTYMSVCGLLVSPGTSKSVY